MLFWLEEVFCWFWAYGSYIFLKVHKICNWLMYYLTIFGNYFDFLPYGEPPAMGGGGEGVCPCGSMPSCTLIFSSFTFFWLSWWRNIWAEFHAFITICTIEQGSVTGVASLVVLRIFFDWNFRHPFLLLSMIWTPLRLGPFLLRDK